MTTTDIYVYGNTYTPLRRADGDKPTCTRLTADDGNILYTDGGKTAYCIDIPTGAETDWKEKELPRHTEALTLEALAGRIAAIEKEQEKQNANIEMNATGLTDAINAIMGGDE